MVFPLYDDNPFKRAKVPYVTWGLILLNVGVFLFELGTTDNAVKALLASFAATPAAITHQVPPSGGSRRNLHSLATCSFMADGSTFSGT
jgi:membrane associated rhomboid family serine protease